MSLFYKEASGKSSTIEQLLYACDPDKLEKGMLSDQPRLSRVTYTVLLCHWGQQLLKDMMFLGTDFETHAIRQGYIEDPTAKDFVARKVCTIAFCNVHGSCHRTSNNYLIQEFETLWGFLARAALSWLSGGLCHMRKCQLKDIIWEKVWFAFAQQMFAPETFGERRKGERKLVVSLLPGSCKRHALRNPCVLCQKYGGACMTY